MRNTAADMMSIGAVLAELREEFPEVTISKIRFLEAEGLVEPQRTPSGYRKFTRADVDRLAQVLRMQRDQYLPLKVIREQLDAQDRGEAPRLPGPAVPYAEELPAGLPADADPDGPVTLDRAGLLEASEVSPDELADWESYGLITPDAGGRYAPAAALVARLLSDLGRFGFEPRHLRGVKAAADREAGLIEAVVAPLKVHRNPRTRARAENTAHELVSLASRLHEALVRAALGTDGVPAGNRPGYRPDYPNRPGTA
ncbi:MerR family transcriptional regulator [Streptomyces boninensis]|uniref:transcriptional regulator FtsR n=1 Tax=Streptomyces boninensis TaxID=2039455 RepID=UPI003B21D027